METVPIAMPRQEWTIGTVGLAFQAFPIRHIVQTNVGFDFCLLNFVGRAATFLFEMKPDTGTDFRYSAFRRS